MILGRKTHELDLDGVMPSVKIILSVFNLSHATIQRASVTEQVGLFCSV